VERVVLNALAENNCALARELLNIVFGEADPPQEK
jgi:hypothetical protein